MTRNMTDRKILIFVLDFLFCVTINKQNHIKKVHVENVLCITGDRRFCLEHLSRFYAITPLRLYTFLYQFFILDPSRSCIGNSFFIIFFVIGVIAFKPDYFRIPLKCKHMCGYPVEEPSVV